MSDSENKDVYLDLYKHYESAASSVKGAMFKNLTWIFGIASALLAVIYSNALKELPPDSKISLEQISLLVFLSGEFICAYALVSIYESAQHIRKNWDMADTCKLKVPALKSILGDKTISVVGWLYGVPVCRRLFYVVIGYGAAFIYTYWLFVKCA